MPEGPELRRYAVAMNEALVDRPLTEVAARTRHAKEWLLNHPNALVGKRVLQVRAHGKNLFGRIEGDYFFYSHMMMWGHWHVMTAGELAPPDRRERARLVNQENACVLWSAPVFELGEGNPCEVNEFLRALGPDILPYEGSFDENEFLRRLLLPENLDRDIGAALLDQRIAAGIGNYLRAEILFHSRMNPFRKASSLTPEELYSLAKAVPTIAGMAYEKSGITICDAWRERSKADSSLVYPGARERGAGARYAVFRRTNLPCLRCGTTIRQTRQITFTAGDDEDGSLAKAVEKSRIIYFCPRCQNVEIEDKRQSSRRRTVVTTPSPLQ